MPVLSWNQVAAAAISGGFPPGPAVIATAITQPESSRDSSVIQANVPYDVTGWGLWQITPGDSVPQYGINQAMLDPLNNARAAVWKWRDEGGFSPWTTYEHNLEVSYLGQAQQAVSYVTGLSARALSVLLTSARAGRGESAVTAATAPDWAAQVRAGTVHLTRVSAAHAAGVRALTAIIPVYTAPAVIIPGPATVLVPPERIRNAR